MHQDGFVKIYSRLAIVIAVLGALALMDTLFTGPLAFVTGWSDVTLGQWVVAGFAFALTLLVTRVIKREIIHGWMERRSGKQVPQLIGNMLGGVVVFIGICLILALVFKRDITALVATGGASAMVIGIAVRDIIQALFTGIVLNVEKPFKVGDMIRINDKIAGKVERITWRTTVLQTRQNDIVYVPNISLGNAIILNQSLPDTRCKRAVEVLIDYDTSVESAERILYAAVLGASGVKQVAAPAVLARRMDRDGVVYEVSFTISDYSDDKKSEHAVIKSILKCMRDAEITVSFPKSEVIHSDKRVRIANRSLDVFRLVQQCRLFKGLPDAVGHRISQTLVERHFTAGATVVLAGERRHAIFVIGEGMAKRTLSNRDGSRLVQERFIATEFFGRSSLFACQPQVATVQAETAVLAYELDRHALTTLFAEMPELMETLAKTLSYLNWAQAHPDQIGIDPPADVIERRTNLHLGQMESNYTRHALPAANESEAVAAI